MTEEPEDRTPEELREEQAEKARDERRHAEHATTEHDAVTHDRRSDKAAYLAAKLAERERSDEESRERHDE
jgi:hypothetical protein